MRILDTLTGEKRNFTPLSDQIRMYVCGVTPYAPAHVGHAMSSLVFDIVRRYLEYLGHSVLHVQNFTDVDDKLIERAEKSGSTVTDLAEEHIGGYLRDMDALNILRAHHYPRATEEIPKIIELIAGLEESGFAYPSAGDVYFRVSRAPRYGNLSKRTLDNIRSVIEEESTQQKEHPVDFALWKAAKPGEPYWESPWGKGRPGWHIECSAMAIRYLGDSVDIHGGGVDLVFPHHENEIAQSEAFTEVSPFAQFWMHNGMVQVGQAKMSKSLGNMVTVGDALQRFPADALRMAVLSSHYRSPSVYSDESIEAAGKAVARLRDAAQDSRRENFGDDQLDFEPFKDEFIRSMDDDFNTPRALAALFDLAREINRTVAAGGAVSNAQKELAELSINVLGFSFTGASDPVDPDLQSRIEELIERRAFLRAAKDFLGADQVRSLLSDLNVIVTDTPDGTKWHIAH